MKGFLMKNKWIPRCGFCEWKASGEWLST